MNLISIGFRDKNKFLQLFSGGRLKAFDPLKKRELYDKNNLKLITHSPPHSNLFKENLVTIHNLVISNCVITSSGGILINRIFINFLNGSLSFLN